jgi:hypothetical protein
MENRRHSSGRRFCETHAGCIVLGYGVVAVLYFFIGLGIGAWIWKS